VLRADVTADIAGELIAAQEQALQTEVNMLHACALAHIQAATHQLNAQCVLL
jgi:hypothetical protein